MIINQIKLTPKQLKILTTTERHKMDHRTMVCSCGRTFEWHERIASITFSNCETKEDVQKVLEEVDRLLNQPKIKL